MKVRRGSRKRRLLITAGVLLVEVLPLWTRGYGLGGNVVVRCRREHLFTTIWIPGVSVKSVRLGPWRLQRCPVGPHLSIVTPVSRAALTESERARARDHRDVRFP
jgi:hypothetical protein